MSYNLIASPLFERLGEAAKILRSLPFDSGRSYNLLELLLDIDCTSEFWEEIRDCTEI